MSLYQTDYENTFDRLKKRFGQMQAWKIAALFFGARDVTAIPDPLNPNFLKRAGYSAARNILMEGLPLKLPTQDSMIGAGYSPLMYDGEKLANTLTSEYIYANDFPLKIPGSIENLLPTSSGAVGIMSFAGCSFFDKGKECSFCTVGPAEGKKGPSPATVMSELDMLISTGFRPNNIIINTGQMKRPGADLELIGKIANAITEKFTYPVAAEIGPFYLSAAKNLGEYLERTGLNKVDSFMINVELADDFARKALCPAKPKLETYLDVMVRLAGLGYQVTSVLQLNYYPELEKMESIRNFLQRIEDYGIIPELLISRAVPGSEVKDSYWQALSGEIPEGEAQKIMLDRFSLFTDRLEEISLLEPGKNNPRPYAGCTRCGMCNINSAIIRDRPDYQNFFKNPLVK